MNVAKNIFKCRPLCQKCLKRCWPCISVVKILLLQALVIKTLFITLYTLFSPHTHTSTHRFSDHSFSLILWSWHTFYASDKTIYKLYSLNVALSRTRFSGVRLGSVYRVTHFRCPVSLTDVEWVFIEVSDIGRRKKWRNALVRGAGSLNDLQNNFNVHANAT